MKYSYCPLCDLLVAEHGMDRHINGERCKARVVARRLLVHGLVPVEFRHANKYTTYVNGIAKHIDQALALFNLPHELHPTRAARDKPIRGSGRGDQAWTTQEGVAMMEIINAAARLLTLSFPETAQRLHKHQNLMAPFDAARRLGAPENKLVEMLWPIDYTLGSDGKKRRVPR